MSTYISPANLCQLGFITISVALVAVLATPRVLQDRLLDYGARAVSSKQARPNKPPAARKDVSGNFISQLFYQGRVPHAWFASFYAAYITFALFWATQWLSAPGSGYIMQKVACWQANSSNAPSMTVSQIMVLWLMMLFQGTRRLYECMTLTKPGSASMAVTHWLLGIWFYASMSVAIWIEGSATICHSRLPTFWLPILDHSLSTTIGLIIFLLGSLGQHQCHVHLYGLKKYTLPDHGMFKYLICPHYTCECLVYVALLIVASPSGRLVNVTLLTALVFVVTNLGVTARATRRWYASKFGANDVQNRWNMIPGVF